jgi:hypothetical protein
MFISTPPLRLDIAFRPAERDSTYRTVGPRRTGVNEGLRPRGFGMNTVVEQAAEGSAARALSVL